MLYKYPSIPSPFTLWDFSTFAEQPNLLMRAEQKAAESLSLQGFVGNTAKNNTHFLK